jgi:hypothetical protein
MKEEVVDIDSERDEVEGEDEGEVMLVNLEKRGPIIY